MALDRILSYLQVFITILLDMIDSKPSHHQQSKVFIVNKSWSKMSVVYSITTLANGHPFRRKVERRKEKKKLSRKEFSKVNNKQYSGKYPRMKS